MERRCAITHGNPESRKIAGLGPMLRDAGEIDVPKKAEAEMAAALHWLMGLAIKHGDRWAEVFDEELARLRSQIAARRREGVANQNPAS